MDLANAKILVAPPMRDNNADTDDVAAILTITALLADE